MALLVSGSPSLDNLRAGGRAGETQQVQEGKLSFLIWQKEGIIWSPPGQHSAEEEVAPKSPPGHLHGKQPSIAAAGEQTVTYGQEALYAIGHMQEAEAGWGLGLQGPHCLPWTSTAWARLEGLKKSLGVSSLNTLATRYIGMLQNMGGRELEGRRSQGV